MNKLTQSEIAQGTRDTHSKCKRKKELRAKRSFQFDPSLNMARQALYRFAALSFVDPRAGAWDVLNALRDDPLLAEAAALMRSLPQARSLKYGIGESPIELLDHRMVLDRLPNSAPALNTQYENTFGLLVSSNCPPYETEYINSKFAFQRSNGLADISGYYHAFGLTPSDQHPERHDHIVLELEFMATLLVLEREADDEVPDRRRDRQQVCRDAQSRFLQQHLGWWIPAFSRLLGKQNAHGFYDAAGIFLTALLPAERGMLGIPPVSKPVLPTSVERPEDCEGCQLVG
jgi:TorA maturation chaperone TorD